MYLTHVSCKFHINNCAMFANCMKFGFEFVHLLYFFKCIYKSRLEEVQINNFFGKQIHIQRVIIYLVYLHYFHNYFAIQWSSLFYNVPLSIFFDWLSLNNGGNQNHLPSRAISLTSSSVEKDSFIQGQSLSP